jgi:hypothetical protein
VTVDHQPDVPRREVRKVTVSGLTGYVPAAIITGVALNAVLIAAIVVLKRRRAEKVKYLQMQPEMNAIISDSG